MVEKLMMIRNALCKIEVHGYENMNLLLGCIQAIDKLAGECTEEGENNERN